MATSIEASRLLTYQAAWLESNGLPYGKESAMAKLMAGDTAMKVTTEAVQVFRRIRLYKRLSSRALYARCKNYANLRGNTRNSTTCYFSYVDKVSRRLWKKSRKYKHLLKMKV